MKGRYLKLALKNIKNRGVRSWLTILGIFIGIAAVVALVSLGSALEDAVLGQFEGLGSDTITVSSVEQGFGPPGSGAVTKFDEDDVDLINNVRGVDKVIPRYVRSVEVNFRGSSEFIFATNIPDDREKSDLIYQTLNLEIDEGRLIKQGDSNSVLLGSSLKENSNFERDLERGDSIDIGGDNYRIVGVLKPTGSFTLDDSMYLPQEDLENSLGIDEEYDVLAVEVENRDELEEVSDRIEQALREDRNQDVGEEDFEVETPLETAGTINNVLDTVNIIVIGIALVSLFVGGVGIMNTMYTSVLERTKEIGLMKSIGARNSDIFSIFMAESGFMGLIGGIIGSIIGIGMALLAALFARQAFPGIDFNVEISIALIVLAIGFSLVVGIFSGTFPATKASKLNPVEALRK